ncbi:MAG TPA: RNA methyltransferase [Planctomycetota bacterium]|nr:RNA methyltransferase [Planctomycetota bacterium]
MAAPADFADDDASPSRPRRRGAGSARANSGAAVESPLTRIETVLVEPKGPRNIGSTCRALKNFGFRRLALVNPAVTDHPEAREMASSAGDVLREARVCATLDEALRDATFVVGTTARPRHRVPVKSPAEAALEILAHALSGGEVALVFGREDHGLSQDELLRCHLALNIETAPEYGSLNLAQAVLLVAYEIFRASALPSAKAQGVLGRFLTAEWRAVLEDELYRALIKLRAMHPSNAAGFRESLTRVLTAGPMQTRDVRVLFALARHAQRVADPTDPGARPPRAPKPRERT